MKKFIGWIAAAFGLITSLFLFERYKSKKLEVNLFNSESKSTDKVLEYKQTEQSEAIKEEQRKIEELEKDHDKGTVHMTPAEVEKYWAEHK